MPIYEYRCNQCHRKFSQLVLEPASATSVTCSHCDSRRVTKLISTVAVHRSEASRLATLDRGSHRDDDFYKDRQNIGLWAKKQMQRRGIQPSSQFEEVVEKARSGKFLEES
jgi:putative FmdB family regulatory protein